MNGPSEDIRDERSQPIPRVPSIPRHALPPGACDCHAHVFGPFDRFPPVKEAPYEPPLAPFETYRAMLARVGMERGVLAQTALYGTDNRSLLDALGKGRGWLRAVAGGTRAISDAELDTLHAAGVRALRFIEMPDPRGGRYGGGVGVEELLALAPRLRERGWHAHVWANAADHAALLPSLIPLGLPTVIDHMGNFPLDQGVNGTAFQRILGHLAAGEIWVKLQVCRNSRLLPHYSDIRAFHDALVAANPRRLLWGSDWPHVRMAERTPDVGQLIDLFFDWVSDASLQRAILVDNPHELFRFEGVRSDADASHVSRGNAHAQH